MFDEQPDGDPHGECAVEIHRLAAEIERLRADSELLAWVLAHPETSAEVLQDASWEGDTVRALVERRCNDLTPNL